ncbi:MAG: 30S ribosomal protein S19 [Candidatus Woesearchaeota archaeon]
MAKKEFRYKGKSVEELKQMTSGEFAKITTSRIRRTINRGFTDEEKKFLDKLAKDKDKPVKTHCRTMVVLPEMISKKVKVHTGKVFQDLEILPEMVGHTLGEFVQSRNRVAHSSPGVGASRSSAGVQKK